MSTAPSTPAADANAAESPDFRLARGLSTRHIRFIALGTAIGTGLFLGSASAIQLAGPAVLLAYLAAGAAIYVVMRAMAEMVLRTPDASSFVDFTQRYLGRTWGFVIGWIFTLEMLLVGIADVTALRIYLGSWWPAVPGWVWMVGTIALVLVLNLVAVRLFGETEFWLTLLKVGAIVAMVVLGVGLLVTGAGLPTGQPSVTHLWDHGGFAPHGAWGILLSLTVVVFAFGGIETVGLTAAESENPHRSIPGAINTVPWRILLFYVGSVGVMLTLAPWTGITGEQSPFVQIIDAVGLPAAAHVLNAVVIIAAFSALNAITFAIGRTLFGLAAAGHAPAVFGRVSGRGVPGAAIVTVGVALVIGLVLNLVVPDRVFTFVASLASFATVFVWLLILAAHHGLRRRIARGALRPGAFATPGWPWVTALAAAFLVLVLVMMAFLPEGRAALAVGVVTTALLVGLGHLSARRSDGSSGGSSDGDRSRKGHGHPEPVS